MSHWHQYNPWADSIVYVPIKELAECCAGGTLGLPDGSSISLTVEVILEHWGQRTDKLDAYILPQPDGYHSIGIRYGRKGEHYISPHGDTKKIQKLLDKWRHVQ